MKEYKLVDLIRTLSPQLVLPQAEDIINQYVADGWQLQEIVSPNDTTCVGKLIGVFFREKTM